MPPCNRYDDEIFESYVLGTLPADQNEALEAHCFACDACFATVRQLRDLREGLTSGTRSSAVREAGRSAPWFRRWTQSVVAPQPLALAAGVAIVALGLGWQQRARFDSQLERLQAPRTSLTTVTLRSSTRGDLDTPAFPADNGAIVLEFDLPGAPADAAVERVDIVDSAGDVLWSGDSLPPINEFGTRILMLSPGFLPSGNYRLEVVLTTLSPPAESSPYVFEFQILSDQ